jgi:hypothetical protein
MTLELGSMNYVVDCSVLPPIGTVIQVHKHLADGGSFGAVEVLSHEWDLKEASEENGNPWMEVRVRTKPVRR